MSTINAVPFRSTIFYTAAGVPAATGSVLTIGSNGVGGFTTNLGSTMVSIGASTNQTYNNFTSGSYTTWATAKSAITSANKTVQSANGLYQLVVANTTSNLSLSSDSGITWSTLSGGLPTLTGSAYWSDGAISANGQYITLSMYGGSPWISADYGRTFALTNQPTPSIWLPLNGSIADSMGSSTVTTPGTVPGYVTLNYPGYTAQAVNLANTAGAAATRYIRGTWAGASNFTVSLWFNAQTVNGTLQPIFEAYFSGIGIFINTNNVLYFQFPNGGAVGNTQLQTQFTLSVNTWYYVTAMFQTNGLCFFYVNNTLIASSTNTGGVGTIPSSGFFGLGTYDTTTTNAFNGYIDDLRITNSVSAYVPIPLLQPNIWMPFENSTADLGSNAITPTVTGSLSYVTGVAGINAVNLANTAGGTATNYIRGAWAGASNFTVSFWFNLQSLGVSYQNMFSSYTAQWAIDISSDRLELWYNSASRVVSSTLSINTWYHAVGTFIANGTGELYLNGTRVGTYSCGATAGTSSGLFSIGTNDVNTANAGNIYIDDLRIYNATIPIHALLPQNYRSLALSGTGQYALAAAASGWVVGSSDSLRTWSKQAVNVGTQAPASSSLALNHTGQYQMVATGPAAGSIMPQLSGLAASTWTQGGVNWTASASSIYGGSFVPYNAFNNTYILNDGWAASATNYNTSGTYTGSVTTTVTGIGSVSGDWLQIQSNIPLVMYSYLINVVNVNGVPKTVVIAGSTDGSTWYALQSASYGSNPYTTQFQTTSGILLVNYSGSQTITGNGSSVTVTTTPYSYSTTAYQYFRLIYTSNFSYTGPSYAQTTEWAINFSNSVSYSTNYGSTWLNTSSTVSNESVALSASGQYALSTNSVAPLARLTLDNTNVDAQGVLGAPTVVGTPGYSTSIKAVGTHSAQFANATVGGTPTVYLNYTVPTVLNKPSALTISCWVYPTSLAADSCAWMFANSGLTVFGPNMYVTSSGQIYANMWSVNGNAQVFSGTNRILANTWSHLAVTFIGSSGVLFINGVQVGSNNSIAGPISLNGGGTINNFLVGTGQPNNLAYQGYIDDVRLYTSALNADEINGLFKNPALTQTVAVSSSYLPITSYTEPVLPGITANVVDTAVSQTGQYMVAVTSSTTNNVYYSTDFGATFTALTVGSSAMVSCSISYDGSYLTVENATTLYTLNRNTQGFTVAVGNQAGLTNQASNAIAIGNQAGKTNQSANSIILNASGSALDAVAPGFYVAPVATTTSSSATSFALLGYGTDNQVTQTNLNVLSNGNVGINATSPMYKTQIVLGSNSDPGTSNIFALTTADSGAQSQRLYMGLVDNGGAGTNSYSWISASRFGYAYNSLVFQPVGGNVGIGTTNPIGALSVALNGTGSNGGGGWDASYVVFGPGANLTNGSNVGITYNTAGNYGALICITPAVAWRDMNYHANQHIFNIQANERMRINTAGWVGIGTDAPSANVHIRGPVANSSLLQCWMTTSQLLAVQTTGNSVNASWNVTDTVLRVSRDAGSGRSISAGGTINANGADYAEYMTKDSDFSAQKGDLLGVLASGKLTNQFDDAIHFLLKSTNPCMVGGDVWGMENVIGEKPKDPTQEATEEEKAAHVVALADWEARLEAERQKVDRMAFAGQVPVNIMGTTPGNYIIPLRNADGSIGMDAVSTKNMTFSQYQSAVGRVISILSDGRANVIVKVV